MRRGKEVLALRQSVLLFLLALGLVWPAVGNAQSPARPELLVNRNRLVGYQQPQDLSCQQGGLCDLVWGSSVVFSTDPPRQEVLLLVSSLDPIDGVRNESVLEVNPSPFPGSLVTLNRRSAAFWDSLRIVGNEIDEVPGFRWLDRALQPLGGRIEVPEPLARSVRGLRQAAKVPGGFVLAWSAVDLSVSGSPEQTFLTFFDETGRETRPPLDVVGDPLKVKQAWPGCLAVDSTAGVITVVFQQYIRDGSDSPSDVYFRRYSLTGAPLTSETRMNSLVATFHGFAALAGTPGGGFVATWTTGEQDGSHQGIFGRRFDAAGAPLGPEFQVNQVTLSDQLLERIATNATGDFVVVWKSYDPSSFGLYAWDIKARLYRADGRPVGPEIYVNQQRELEQELPLVAFASDGTFVAAWSGNGQVPPFNVIGLDVFARRFSASRGDEPCIVGGGHFRCDTGRTGGELEVDHAFGGADSGLGLLGDVDGDGRADPCVYVAGVFRCDTDHEGGTAEVKISFSVAGTAAPLLGDMDGDGRADPCLATPGWLACDTAHDGGRAELRLPFGRRGDVPLVGDVDGDGRAEACAYAKGVFRCDTRHDGGAAEWSLRFGQAGDQPLLGDFDGDGRADPCVFRQGVLLCDTAHNGGAAEGTLSLGRNGDRIVLGNLDGL